MAKEGGFFGKIKYLFAASDITPEFYEELEEMLILSDVGMIASEELIEDLRFRAFNANAKFTWQLKALLKELIAAKLAERESDYFWLEEPALLMIVGVNGVGKTTSIGKLARLLTGLGKKVVLVAADTFRAGAIEQLKVWGERTGCEVICQKEGADPSSVLFDGISAAKARGADVILCDTAGRLHNKKNLMDELAKMNRVAEREAAGYRKDTLIVLDATTGQNALSQAKVFSEVTDVGSIILTKTDGTAKGGVLLAIGEELGLPISYLGCGEGAEDFKAFDAAAFAEDMFRE